MDFMNRSSQPAAPVRVATSGSPASSGKVKREGPTWLRIALVVLLFSATILVVSMVALFYFGGTKESDHIDKNKQQAVFLTNGQVYFGKIKAINDKFLDLRSIYYLNVNQQVQPNQKDKDTTQATQVKLVKLGCELHSPTDKMVINRDQVSFWENLNDDGQVAQAIAKWVKENPNGQKCQTVTDSTAPSTTTPTKP